MPGRKPPSVVLALVTLACAPALAPLASQGPLELEPGEGLLILHVDTDVPLTSIRLDRGEAAASVPRGHHVWMMRASGGRYRFSAVHLGAEAGRAEVHRLKNGEEFEFAVEAGRINYPGALIVRSHERSRSAGFVRVRCRNRSAMAVRMLREQHAAILARYDLRYAGSSGDGFLEHYSAARRQETGVTR